MHDENKIKLFIHKSLCSRIFTEVALTWFFSTFKNTTIKSGSAHLTDENRGKSGEVGSGEAGTEK